MKNGVKLLSVLLTSMVILTTCKAQHKEVSDAANKRDRPAVVAGSFYPSDPGVLNKTLENFFKKAPVLDKEGEVCALILPHAGYVYAGQVAAAGVKQLDRTKAYDHIFIIGPSHHVGFQGASVFDEGNYTTPLGEVEVDVSLAKKLIGENDCFVFNPQAHAQEHAIEVQLPYLQYWLKKPFKLVPVVIGTQDLRIVRQIADALKKYFKPGNLFVISSDMSHYPAYADAEEADQRTLGALVKNDPKAFIQALEENSRKRYPNLVTSMCGWPAVLSLLEITGGSAEYTYQKVLYQNSGDIPQGDKNRVVGYGSVIVTKQHTMEQNFLTEKDKQRLLQLARDVLKERIINGKTLQPDADDFPGTLQQPAGAFVTLTEDGKLRGCIGRFQPDQPLYEVVRDMTIAAALHDYRFSPVQAGELKNIEIEISVLTPLKKIDSADEFELGKEGIYMTKNGRSGTFLPQVAKETGWTKEEFLGHCARDKAGIGWEGWKEAALYTYEAIIFSEKELGLR